MQGCIMQYKLSKITELSPFLHGTDVIELCDRVNIFFLNILSDS